MHAHDESNQENKQPNLLPAATAPGSRHSPSFVDNRPEAAAQRHLHGAINDSPRVQQQQTRQAAIDTIPRQAQVAQRQAIAGKAATEQPGPKKANQTGLPDQLKAGVESLAGHSLDDVRVHYNSDKPARLQAHAYAQGTDIHLAPGQEQHLPHEAWHVVQQKQGRVQPTRQLKGKVSVNDDAGLEQEADVMGAKALQLAGRKLSGPAVVGASTESGGAQRAQQAPLPAGRASVVAQMVWNVAETTRQKSELDAGNFFPGGANGSALHHIISRDSMKKLSRALALAQENDVAEAVAFWQTARGAMNQATRVQSNGLRAKMLENMPLNLSYGPNNPLNDPGSGFDPDTVPAAEGEEGERELAPVSAQLVIINDIIQNNPVEVLGSEESGDLWTQANTALQAAIVAHDNAGQLNAPEMEQWLDNEDGRFFRKGLYKYADGAAGADKFQHTPIPALAGIGMRAPDAAIDEALDEETEDEFATWSYATTANLTHFLARHTYEYFTFADEDIKLVNTFWPEGTTVENIIEYATTALLYGDSYVTDLHENKDEDEDLPEFIGIKNTRVPGVPTPVYLMFGVEDKGANVYEIDLRTLAPDGNVDAYTAASLEQIRDG
ncbi:eCIS core domain-containing protein [Hymenobacter elongatus]|uniref:DUF4157 domain-containing protein n=1 Tax=Hymenobacter elongatus TaxID=877208 RepID=A0A4Z0PNS8_9BACT|nr:DUF4157 domain-containing protein [Hymenobacter elongatus]TGE18911.1 DUF4157 domain-containing protein [Hymenobacter elongatus]